MEEPEERQERLKKTILQYSEMVYRLAYALVKDKYDADDIYQEVFTGYLRKNPQFQNREHEKAWFIRVTVNHCKNFWKSARQHGEEAFAAAPYTDDGQEAELIEKVKLLPEKYRTVIQCHSNKCISFEVK